LSPQKLAAIKIRALAAPADRSFLSVVQFCMKRTAIRDQLNKTIVSALQWGTRKLRGSKQLQPSHLARRPFQSSQIVGAPLLVVSDVIDLKDARGLLLHRLFGEQNPWLVATSGLAPENSRVGGQQVRFSGKWRNRQQLFGELASLLAPGPPSYILCAPGSERELQVAVAAADISGAALVLYMIGDLESSSQLDSALCEAIEKSSLIFAVSESFRAKYQKKYGRKVWLLPPVVPEGLGSMEKPRPDEALRGILLGASADSARNERLQALIRKSEIPVTWIVAPDRVTALGSASTDASNISIESDAPEDAFEQALAQADFVLVFDAIQEENGENSLDIRVLSDLLCTVCWAGLPVLCIGNKSSEIGKLIEAWGLGSCIEPGKEGLRCEIDKLLTPERRRTISKQAMGFRSIFSAQFTARLLRSWIDQGFVVANPFDKLFEPVQDKLTPFVDSEAPRDIHWEFRPHYDALMRIKRTGYRPDFIVDLGASTGYWSLVAQRVFEEAHFFLVDPLIEKYREEEGGIYRLHPEFNRIAAAVGASAGETVFHVSQDLYGSSIFDVSAFPDDRRFTSLKVPIRTLDEIAKTEKIDGRGILKIDVQFSEHLVLEGATQFLDQVDFVVIEVSLKRFTPEVKVLDEFVDSFKSLGFRYYDFAGNWRDPDTGELLQHDIIFGRDTK
jgi:FkbM family methyltransferase